MEKKKSLEKGLPIEKQALELRVQWMREMGLSEDEIAEFCNTDKYPARLEEELRSLKALRDLQGIDTPSVP